MLPDAAPDRSWYFSRKAITVQGGYGVAFCRQDTNLIEHYACRGTSLIEASKLSRRRMLVGGTGAVSRYKFDSEPETCHGAGLILWAGERVRVQVPVGFVMGAGVKQKA